MLYRASKIVGAPFLKLLHRMEIVGGEHVPQDGPCIVAANHCSYLDPFWLATAFPRQIHYLMLSKIYHHPFLHWYCRGVGAIPLRHEGDALQSLRGCLRLLNAGQVVGIFPEGARSRDGKLQPIKPGVIHLSLRSRAKIVPAGIRGGFAAFPPGRKIPRPSKILVAFGPPLPPPSQDEEEAALLARTQELWEQIHALAGFTEGEPS